MTANCNQIDSLEEIPLRVGRVHTPPSVDEYVEDRQDEHEERRRPFGLEANGDHTACPKANKGHEGATDTPLAPDDESKEEENQQYTGSEQEAVMR